MKGASLAILFFLFSVNKTPAQSPTDILNWHRDSLPQEQIYLHFDRQAYVAGETIWFKAYLRTGNTPGARSTSLYVDLLDRQGAILVGKRFPIIQGVASGTLELAPSLGQNIYLVRAYTAWTRNLGQSFVFKKSVPVFNPQSAVSFSTAAAVNLEFFPESGKLVAGLTNNIAFFARDSWRQPVPVRAELLDSKGNSLGVFSENKSEGLFNFVPRAGERYVALVRTSAGTSFRQDLPPVQENGAVMIVADEEEEKSFSISISPGLLPAGDSLLLLGTIRNEVVLESTLRLRGNEVAGAFSSRNFPAGLLHLLLFDTKHRLLATRATLVQKNPLVPVELRLNASGRLDSSNILQFIFPEAVTGTFSVSITDADREIFADSADNLLPGLLLQPGARQILKDPWPQTEQEADVVALSNEWYGSDWPRLAGRRQPLVFTDYYITVFGRITRDTVPVSEPINMLVQSRNLMQTSLRVSPDANGEFTLQGLVYEDTARFYFDLPGLKRNRKTGLSLKLSEEKADFTELFRDMDYSFAASAEHVFTNPRSRELAVSLAAVVNKSVITLPEVVKETRNRRESVNNRYAKGLFNASPAKIYDFITHPPSRAGINVFDYLQGQISGLTIEKAGGGYNLFSSRAISTYEQFFGNRRGMVPGKVFLDEVESNTQTVMRIPIQQIALVKYFEPGALMLPGVGQSPILAVWTKTPADLATPAPIELNFARHPGYSPSSGFYLPLSASGVATLCWNPDIEVRNEQQFSIEFRKTQEAKRLRVVAQGYTADGRLMHVHRFLQ